MAGRRVGEKSPPEHVKVKRARELKDRGLKPVDIGKVIGASRATVYRYLSLGEEWTAAAAGVAAAT